MLCKHDIYWSPSATQTLSEDTPVGYYYYSVGIDMTGYVDIGIGRDGQGVRYSRVNFDTVQQAGSENAAEDQYIGENLLSKSDITSTFYYNIRNRSTGGGGSTGGVTTPRPTATAQPGATSEPGATADPNATPEFRATHRAASQHRLRRFIRISIRRQRLIQRITLYM